jgi:hypothetical protein
MARFLDAAPRTAGKPRFLLWLGAALVATVTTAAFVVPWRTTDDKPVLATPVAVPMDAAKAVAQAAEQRPVYKYSVLPGGAHSREELADKAAKDKVAAAHYGSFDIDKAHVTIVPRARTVHVSYRKGDRIYWTKRKVTLAAGETLLSDGRSTIRTRCGNRISDTPQLPVEPNGPGEEELDTVVPTSMPVPEGGTPVVPGSFASNLPPGNGAPPARTAGPGGFGVPGGAPFFFPGVGGPGLPGAPGGAIPIPTTPIPAGPVPTSETPGDPMPLAVVPEPLPVPRPGTPDYPTEVPEPSTLWLGVAGAGALLLRRRRR